MTTIVEQLKAAQESVVYARGRAREGDAAREFALASTALEDAIMRVNRGFAIELGVFQVGDVEADLAGHSRHLGQR